MTQDFRTETRSRKNKKAQKEAEAKRRLKNDKMKKKKQKRRKNSPCAAKSTRTSGKICCNILSSRYDGLNLKCQSLIDEIFRNAWNILEKYTLSLSLSLPLSLLFPLSLSFPFSFSLCRVVCCGSRGSSADEFSCRDWSLGEAFGWCLIWTPHSSSLLADLWPHRKALPQENTPGFFYR